MQKKIIVISLGGSLIVPKNFDYSFLSSLKKTLRTFYSTHKFVLVCGGGTIARQYISALKHEHKSKIELARAGIRATRMNAQFLMQLFGKEANDKLPLDMKCVESQLKKNNIVITGALRFTPNVTSDNSAAKLAAYLKVPFINMTNVYGLYNKDPAIDKSAKLIKYISWEDFEEMAKKIPFQAGQHFVIDQKTASLIRKRKVDTYIVGKSLKNLKNLIKGESFKGTTLHG